MLINLIKFGCCLGVMSILIVSCEPEKGNYLFANGETDYRIMLSQNADSLHIKSAEELQSYLKLISNIDFPIVDDTSPLEGSFIFIGENRYFKKIDFDFDKSILEDDGFQILTYKNHLIFLGGEEKGILYGVFSFLEDYLNCRKYTSTASIIPKRNDFYIEDINVKYSPTIKYRSLYMPDNYFQSYSDWHKLKSNRDMDRDWGMGVHTFSRLVPPETYFELHPEYFSEINGKRVPDAQLCLSNKEVFNIVLSELKDRIKKKPNAKFWPVDQNDTRGPCQCAECRDLEVRYGGHSGALISFVNSIATKFPDKIITTLAYSYSQSAPKNILPGKNVLIFLCSYDCNRSRPIFTDVRSDIFRNDFRDWRKLTDNIMIWDYIVQFANLISPFPNFHVLKPNLEYFVSQNVNMVFEQGSGKQFSEFNELRSYVIAKLLWNPNCNIENIIDDFIFGYYGEAGIYIKKYIATMHESLINSMGSLKIWSNPWRANKSYLTPALLKKYSDLFDKAESAVEKEPEFLNRVRRARLPLEFAILQIAKWNVTEELSYFENVNDQFVVKKEFQERLNNFVKLCRENGIEQLSEIRGYIDDYENSVKNFMTKGMLYHSALNKRVKSLTQVSDVYTVNGVNALTDGFLGEEYSLTHWLEFKSGTMDVIINMEHPILIDSVSTNFLRNISNSIGFPTSVELLTSNDGEKFNQIEIVKSEIDSADKENSIKTFKFFSDGKVAKFIRIKAINTKMNIKNKSMDDMAANFTVSCDEIILN